MVGVQVSRVEGAIELLERAEQRCRFGFVVVEQGIVGVEEKPGIRHTPLPLKLAGNRAVLSMDSHFAQARQDGHWNPKPKVLRSSVVVCVGAFRNASIAPEYRHWFPVRDWIRL